MKKRYLILINDDSFKLKNMIDIHICIKITHIHIQNSIVLISDVKSCTREQCKLIILTINSIAVTIVIVVFVMNINILINIKSIAIICLNGY